MKLRNIIDVRGGVTFVFGVIDYIRNWRRTGRREEALTRAAEARARADEATVALLKEEVRARQLRNVQAFLELWTDVRGKISDVSDARVEEALRTLENYLAKGRILSIEKGENTGEPLDEASGGAGETPHEEDDEEGLQLY